MSYLAQEQAELIPSPGLVRAELARSVREARRLRSLLKLSMQAEEDRQFVRTLANQRPVGSVLVPKPQDRSARHSAETEARRPDECVEEADCRGGGR